MPERVLAIGAHPDDIEFGCGATLAKWADAGAEVHLLHLHRRLQGHLGPRRRPRPRWSRRARTSSATRPRCSARSTSCSSRRVDGELDERRRDAGPTVCARDPRGHGPTSCSATIRGSRTASIPTTAHAGLLARRRHRRGARSALLPRAGPRAAPARARCCCSKPDAIDHVERVDGYVDRKVDALLAHRSQWRSTMAHRRRDPSTGRSSAAFVDRAARRGAQPPGCAPACAPPRPSPASTTSRRDASNATNAKKARVEDPGPLRIAVIGSALLGGALARVRFVARLAGAFFAALRFVALRFGRSLLGRLPWWPCAWPPSWRPCASWPEPSSRPCAWSPCAWPEPSWPPCASWPEPSSLPCAWLPSSLPLLGGRLLGGLALLGGCLLGSPLLRCLLSRRHGHHLSRRALSLKGSSNFGVIRCARECDPTPYAVRTLDLGFLNSEPTVNFADLRRRDLDRLTSLWVHSRARLPS